jgi:glycosyltransferase involved in cell wall biosynthesis
LGVILLQLLPSFDHSAAGRQVSLLAPVLRRAAEIHVAALGRDGPIAEELRASGISVHVLGTGRRFDLAALWRLRRLVRDLRPQTVHAWRLPALRAAGLLRFRNRIAFRLVVSEPKRGGRVNLLDRWLLRSADAVFASYPAVDVAIRKLGVSTDRIHKVSSAVVLPADDPPTLGLPLSTDAKIIMCLGALRPEHGFRDAIWAADILRYPFPNLHLVVIGDGPERTRLTRFAKGINPAGGHVHFLPGRPHAAALLARADMVWVPSRSECGRQVVLDAMAAGRAVVTTALPGLAALVGDGRTGLLVPPGDPLELARQARPLLEDPALAGRFGLAGREAVADLTPERVAAAYEAIYGVDSR